MKIIVLGCGLIPRIGGIAPLRKPVEADENIIRLILGHGSLKPYQVKEDGTKQEITFANFRKLLADENKKTEIKKTPEVKPAAPKKEEPKKEEKKEEPKPVEMKFHEKKNDQHNNFKKEEKQETFKPVVAEID